jgi:hypothetical protein
MAMRKRFVKEEGREGVGVDGTGSFFLVGLRGRKPSPWPTERDGAQDRLLEFERRCVGVE